MASAATAFDHLEASKMSYFSSLFGALSAKKKFHPNESAQIFTSAHLNDAESISPLSLSSEDSLHDAQDLIGDSSTADNQESPTIGYGIYDVFFASGNFAKGRLGNIALTRICNKYQNQYDSALKGHQKTACVSNVVFKSAVLKNIIEEFKREYPDSKVWTKGSDKCGGWVDITNDISAILGKLQYKLCRKKGNTILCSQVSGGEAGIMKRKRDEVFETKDTVTLCRVIIKLQRENESHLRKIQILESEISSLQQKAAVAREPRSLPEATTCLDVDAVAPNTQEQDNRNKTLTHNCDIDGSTTNGQEPEDAQFSLCHHDANSTVRVEPGDTSGTNEFHGVNNTDTVEQGDTRDIYEGSLCLQSSCTDTVEQGDTIESLLCKFDNGESQLITEMEQNSSKTGRMVRCSSRIATPIRQAYSIINTKKTGAECAFAGEKLTPIAGEITMSSMERIIESMRKLTNFNSSSRIIDIGCGQGKPNFHFAIAVNPVLNVGIELVPMRWFQATSNLTKLCDRA